LGGHQGLVRTLAFSPDGLVLATAGGSSAETDKDWTIRLWEVATASCVRELAGHTNIVRSLAFSPYGRTLATASNDKTIRLWDTLNGLPLATAICDAKLAALAFAPDGRTLTVAEETGVVTVRDPTRLAVLKTFRHESGEVVLNLAFAPDGRTLATAAKSGTIRLWDPLIGQELLSLRGHKAQVNGIALAPDGSSLASCSHDGEVKLWQARSLDSRELSTFPGVANVRAAGIVTPAP
jgi:eukaryotic-like serine/threonine-protein kinase